MKPLDDLTQAQAAKSLSYDPETGIFTRIFIEGTRQDLVGHEAGATCAAGYRRIHVCGKIYKAHRLAFLLHLGRWPVGDVDHIDHDTDNNCWANIRECSHAENLGNRGSSNRTNTSGYRGVSLHKPTGRWWAKISVNGKFHSLKYWDTPEEAFAARREAEIELLGEFAPAENSE